MEAQTAPPPDIDAEARLANERWAKAKSTFEDAQTELIRAERAAKTANAAWLHLHYPAFY